MIDWNSSTIPQAFSGYVPFMSGLHILKDKRGEKTFDAAVYAFGAKTADEGNGTIYGVFVEKRFVKGTISCPLYSALF